MLDKQELHYIYEYKGDSNSNLPVALLGIGDNSPSY